MDADAATRWGPGAPLSSARAAGAMTFFRH
jgi:hypothetical protein